MSRPAPVTADRLARACRRHVGAAAAVDDVRRLSGGASRETWAFTVAHTDGRREALVLRRDPAGNHLGSAERSTEFELLRAAHAAGVPVPRVRFLLEPDDDLGAGFVMDRVDGETIPRKILRDDEYAAARPRLAAQCGEIAARIHAIDRAALPPLAVLGAPEQIAQYREILDGFGEPHPAFELGLRWLEDEIPAAGAGATLVHGDFRNGNLVVGSEGVRSVLDWELAHLGDPVEDLGWMCVRSWRFGELDLPVGGFGRLPDLLAAYARAGGREVAPEQVRYWEAFGTLKWGVICEVQSFTHLRGLVQSVELAALGRRIAETEWDLLALIAPCPGPASPGPATEEPARETGTLHDRPTAAELVLAVREYLEHDVMPATEGRVAFHARVAANVLGVVERELALGERQDAEEHARLRELLGHDGTIAQLTRELAGGIRDHSLDDRRAEVVAAVRATVAAKLAVANPTYAEQPR